MNLSFHLRQVSFSVVLFIFIFLFPCTSFGDQQDAGSADSLPEESSTVNSAPPAVENELGNSLLSTLDSSIQEYLSISTLQNAPKTINLSDADYNSLKLYINSLYSSTHAQYLDSTDREALKRVVLLLISQRNEKSFFLLRDMLLKTVTSNTTFTKNHFRMLQQIIVWSSVLRKAKVAGVTEFLFEMSTYHFWQNLGFKMQVADRSNKTLIPGLMYHSIIAISRFGDTESLNHLKSLYSISHQNFTYLPSGGTTRVYNWNLFGAIESVSFLLKYPDNYKDGQYIAENVYKNLIQKKEIVKRQTIEREYTSNEAEHFLGRYGNKLPKFNHSEITNVIDFIAYLGSDYYSDDLLILLKSILSNDPVNNLDIAKRIIVALGYISKNRHHIKIRGHVGYLMSTDYLIKACSLSYWDNIIGSSLEIDASKLIVLKTELSKQAIISLAIADKDEHFEHLLKMKSSTSDSEMQRAVGKAIEMSQGDVVLKDTYSVDSYVKLANDIVL